LKQETIASVYVWFDEITEKNRTAAIQITNIIVGYAMTRKQSYSEMTQLKDIPSQLRTACHIEESVFVLSLQGIRTCIIEPSAPSLQILPRGTKDIFSNNTLSHDKIMVYQSNSI
jgi:hypothetical protein